MKSWFIVTILVVLANVACSSCLAATTCFLSKAEARQAIPHNQKVFYTTIKTTGNDHVDLLNPGPVGSKCYHMHYKLPTIDHLPRVENYLSTQELFWNHILLWEPPNHTALK